MNRTVWAIAALCFVAGALSMFILFEALGGSSISQSLRALESRNVKNAKATVSKSLFDPYSAQYEDVREINTDVGAMVCGLVNAKNRMGGYVGRKPFYYLALNGEAAVISNNSDAFVYKSFAQRCFPDRRFPRNSGDDAGWGTDK
ncbi:hypothetical protein M2227_002517 [Bradyrhizobium elkanii]|uniref:hypothetical protein n=1 Tax=Bradyrhizobium elkanii TaxID=29448 RepID=UPI002227B357|nr:hypothetical protein [Bradyrhizobium elkanii]MCW2200427.1 hypothetical protein [Bradyrhizobium elkanii]